MEKDKIERGYEINLSFSTYDIQKATARVESSLDSHSVFMNGNVIHIRLSSNVDVERIA